MSFSARVLGIGALLMAGVRFAALPVGAEVLPGAATPPPRLGSGFSYRHDQVARVPWSVQIARVSRSRTNFVLQTTLAGQDSIGVATVSEQMSRWPRTAGRPMAAVNGDYFARSGTHEGDPEGLHISNGELISAPNGKSCFWVDANGGYQLTNVVSQFSVTLPNGAVLPVGLNEEFTSSEQVILYSRAAGRSTHTSRATEYVLERVAAEPWLPLRVGETYAARIRDVFRSGDTPLTTNTLVLAVPKALESRFSGLSAGAVLRVSLSTLPEIQGARLGIGGGPALLRQGRRTDFRSEAVRHPRTAIGWNQDDFFLIQVDGRQPGLSVGMTLIELADYMQKLGCLEALNLDGGGSSTLWADGQVMNNPCEGSERPTGNALAIIRLTDGRGVRTNTLPGAVGAEK
jgi:hypothetical protein